MNISDKNSKAGIRQVSQLLAVVLASVMVSQFAWAAVPNKTTKFSNIGSISNTRHNLTQSGIVDDLGTEISSFMNATRNNYGEVCVYCHTPHGANQTIDAPLWNRTIKVTNYQTYDELGTTSLTQAVTSTPGPASLTCLSCHDGQTAIDSIINMPGSGLGNNAQATTQSTSFLDQWTGNGGPAGSHLGLNSADGVLGNGEGSAFLTYTPCTPGSSPFCIDLPGFGWVDVLTGSAEAGKGCMTCHSDVGDTLGIAGNVVDFRLFNIGTDLRNDHPVGITFPTTNGPGTDWNTPAGIQGSSQFFDLDSDTKMEKGEIRTYNGKVECASCHDPHGVPSAGPGTEFNKTFLRVQNMDGSAVCLTCHVK